MARRLIAEMMTRCGVAFDSSGARGTVAHMTDEVCYAYAAAFVATVASDCAEIVLGYDARASSPRIASACTAAIVDAGRTVVHGGIVPASVVALAAWGRGAAGIMITGGDAAPDRNGLRFFGPAGEPTRQDARRVAACEVDMPAAVLPADLGPVDASVSRAALERVVDAFGASCLNGLVVGVFGEPGTDADLLTDAIESLGARTLRIERAPSAGARWGRPDRTEFDHLALDACTRLTLDAVVAFDGDGSRPMLADETGTWRGGGEIGVIAGRTLQARTLVVPMAASSVYESSGVFGRVVRARTGTRSLLDALAESDSIGTSTPIACDADGALVLHATRDLDGRRCTALPTRDALLPIVAVLRASSEARTPVSTICDALPKRYTARNALTGFTGRRGADLIHRLAIDTVAAAETLAPTSGQLLTTETVDGLRVRFENGDVVHLQATDAPNGLVCSTEAARADAAERLCGECLARIVRQEAEATVSVLVGGIVVPAD